MGKQEKKPKVEKKYFMVEMEGWVPITVQYRILAENPEKALEVVSKSAPMMAPKPKLAMLKRLKARVFLFGTRTLFLTKNY